MNTSTRPDGTRHHSPNPILVAFFQEVRRLSEEVTRREEAAASRSSTNGVHMEEDKRGLREQFLKTSLLVPGGHAR